MYTISYDAQGLFNEQNMGWHQLHGWRTVFSVACDRLKNLSSAREESAILSANVQKGGQEMIPDEQLMEAYRDGDAGAFDQLFTRYKDILYRYLVRQSGNAALAEEMFQEVWAGLIKHRARYTVSAKFKTYLFHIAHNKLIDYYRTNARYDSVSYEETEHDVADQFDARSESMNQPDHHADVTHKVARLMQQIEKLPAAQRDVFLLHEESGMSLAEIAEVMAVSRDTAKSRLRYALQRLRRGMERYS